MAYYPPGLSRFGPFEFDSRTRELRRNGMRVKLTPHQTALLTLLLEPPLRIRTREEIQRHLWPANTFVDFEHGMNKIVHSLREALGDSASNPHYIETVNATGYRFLPQFLKTHSTDKRTLFHDVASIAVLPVTCTAADDRSRGDRITFHLIAGLSVFRHRVIALATVKSYKLEGLAPRDAGELLGVDAVLSGQVTRSEPEPDRTDATLSLTAELIDISDGTLVCAAASDIAQIAGTRYEEQLARDLVHQFRTLLNPAADNPQLSFDARDFSLVSGSKPIPRRRATDFI